MPPFTLKVPASSGNMGAGFDAFGMALSLKNEFSFAPAKKYQITYNGETKKMGLSFSDPKKNYLVRCYRQCCETLGVPEHPFSLRSILRVPPYGGLGSSATAVLAAVTAALLFNNRKAEKEQLFHLSLAFERHPDNIAPSLFGGFTISTRDPITKKYKAHSTQVASDLVCRILLPNLSTSTRHVRRTMPAAFSRADTAANLGYAGLTALSFAVGNYDLLRYAMHDRVHERYRDKPELGYARLKNRLMDAGALGVCLSGSGPAILVLTKKNSPTNADIEESIPAHFQRLKLDYQDLMLRANNRGMQIQHES